MPNQFTAKHDPPIESALVRSIFFGGHEDELRMWKVMDQFSPTGALPSASYGLLMIGVNAMVYHHSTSENEHGQRSVVCSVPGSPFVFVCDAAAIQPKPFGQQSKDYALMVLRQQGLEPCKNCGGHGRLYATQNGVPLASMCGVCGGSGIVPLEKPKTPPAPVTPKPAANAEQQDKIKRLREESGFGDIECRVALELKDWDFEKALEFLDEQRKGLGGS